MEEYNSLEEKEFFETYSFREAKHLLPHGNGIRLVDNIVKVNRCGIITQAHIRPDFPLLEYVNGKKVFPSYKMIEVMAQTLGCFKKVMSKIDELYNRGDMGFLVGARKLEIRRSYVNIGEIINVKIDIDAVMIEGFASCTAVASVGSEEIVSSIISVFSPDQASVDELRKVHHL